MRQGTVLRSDRSSLALRRTGSGGAAWQVPGDGRRRETARRRYRSFQHMCTWSGIERSVPAIRAQRAGETTTDRKTRYMRRILGNWNRENRSRQQADYERGQDEHCRPGATSQCASDSSLYLALKLSRLAGAAWRIVRARIQRRHFLDNTQAPNNTF
ncbi:unnamed protein product [Mycena citricolor]|uniref:Uncharacterized protein n=1 Tax=Mycena citricolor TaxID=2018698 RepID=A0AAD2JXY5_9AGAR|nr:unnamed protein product [Mycena citricolor]